VDEVVAELAAALLAAGNDREQVAAAFGRFIDAGLPICGSPSALWGYVSMALRKAGCDAAETDRRMRVYWTVSWERFCTVPYAPNWPWHEHPETWSGGNSHGAPSQPGG
jgi:hypothetical protein